MRISRTLLVYIVVAATGFATILIATKLNNVPDHDEFAYVANSLYFSGVSPLSGNPAYVERPPLFWWLMTSLLSMGAAPWMLLVVSPAFAVLQSLVITRFGIELSKDLKVGLFAGLVSSFSAYYAFVSSRILTDVMGSFFATLSMYAFYKYFMKKENRILYAPIFGASLALSLVARDESLIMIPLFILLWIFLSMKGSFKRKLSVLIAVGIILGIPVLILGEVGTLQMVSNLATPLVLNYWPAIIVSILVVSYVAYRIKKISYRDSGTGILTMGAFLLPFLYDNYILGNIEYYVAGKGILARPVSHLMMIPQTAGVGAHLGVLSRITGWTESLPKLLSAALILMVVIGFYALYRFNKNDFLTLGLWLVVTLGYVVVETNFEDRFLMIAFAPLAILGGIGLGYLWGLKKWLGAVSLFATLALENLIPRAPISVSNDLIYSALLGENSKSQNWLFAYLPTLKILTPSPILPLAYMVEGVLSLIIGVLAVLFVAGAFKSIEEKTRIEAEPIPAEDHEFDEEDLDAYAKEEEEEIVYYEKR